MDLTECEKELDALAESTARFAAKMYLYLARQVIQDLGPAGEQAVRRGLREFGLARGRGIRAAVQAAGEPLTLDNFRRYYDLPFSRAWHGEGSETPERHDSSISYCPFGEQWLDDEGGEIGQIYCEEVDPALREGYGPHLRFVCSRFLLRDGGPCIQCDEQVAEPE